MPNSILIEFIKIDFTDTKFLFLSNSFKPDSPLDKNNKEFDIDMLAIIVMFSQISQIYRANHFTSILHFQIHLKETG